MAENNLTLAGQVALVTGAARGIGRQIALSLAGAGAAVAIGYRSERNKAREVVAEVESAGGRAMIAQADLADPAQVTSMAADVAAKLGDVSILVHNAAPIRRGAPLTESSWDEFDIHYRVGVQAAWGLSRAVIPAMRQRKFGRIILITTTSTNLYVPGFGAYCSAKAAMETFAKYLAVEVGRDGITVNVVAPGLTEKGDAVHPEGPRFPLGRVAHARDVAEVVTMLAGPASASVTGLIVPVDGGLRLLEPIRGRPPGT